MGCLKLEKYHDQKPLKVVYSKVENQSLGRGKDEVGLIVAGLNHALHGMFAQDDPPGDGGKQKVDLDKVMEHYPGDENSEISPQEAYVQTGGGVKEFYTNHVENYGTDPNGCALRLSIAFNDSGYDLKAVKNITYKGANGKNYFLSAEQMAKHLPKQFNLSASTTRNNTLSSFSNKTGIYFMQPISPVRFGATGHITIWNGSNCMAGHCYNNSSQFYQATLFK